MWYNGPMPSKNIVKHYDSDAMYHVYNRGNNKRQIFFDERDYAVFLSFLKYALLSDESIRAVQEVDRSLLTENQQYYLRRMGLAGKLTLVSYCLMPNHFHLQFFQYDSDAITKLMRSLATGYVMYFNKRYGTSGSLFQGVYKASKVDNDSYYQHISRYIHLNPIDIGAEYEEYKFSSYKYYTGKAKAGWVDPEMGKSGMSVEQYAKFVLDWIPIRKDYKDIGMYLADR